MNVYKRCITYITIISILILSGCSNNISNTNGGSPSKKPNMDYTGLWQHTEYPDSYSIIIYEQSGNKINLVASAMKGGIYGRMISIRNENVSINADNEATFDYQDTNGNTGIGHLILKDENIFLAFTANEPYQGGFCIDAINGDFTKTMDLSEMSYFDAQEYGVDETEIDIQNKKNKQNNITHGKEIDPFDIIDFTVYYEMIGDEMYNDKNALHFWTEGNYEREHNGNIVENGNYTFYKSNNSEYDFMFSINSTNGKYIMLYGRINKGKDIIELYTYDPDSEYPISWYGKYISQAYATSFDKMVR